MKGLETLKRRLAVMRQALPEIPPWPPEEGSFGFCLWDRLGRPGERRGFVDMYTQRAAHFWTDQT